MKAKYRILAIGVMILLYSCDSTTYEELEADVMIEEEITYDAHIKSVIDNNCIVCHSEGGLSSFRPLTNYMEVKDAVETTNLLDRIQRQNGEEGQMPKTGRMTMSNIDLILEWANNGLPEN
ncbi:cytochrome c [Flavobacterium arcticum]|uniref:Cytochrome c n=2 Tax=Flavobacterium arcticum TaxID=1784713 RepID=A0A345HF85_9FLAO|nr:cytochrome c [Flavobacterium arcticum]KAF2507392.1 cytochrome c [Flavobacterium arcticum]